MHVAAWYCGTPDQTSQKSLETCYEPISPLCQISMHSAKQCTRKVLQFFYILQYFEAPGGHSGPKSISLGTDIQQGPFYHFAEFHPLQTTCLPICETSAAKVRRFR